MYHSTHLASFKKGYGTGRIKMKNTFFMFTHAFTMQSTTSLSHSKVSKCNTLQCLKQTKSVAPISLSPLKSTISSVPLYLPLLLFPIYVLFFPHLLPHSVRRLLQNVKSPIIVWCPCRACCPESEGPLNAKWAAAKSLTLATARALFDEKPVAVPGTHKSEKINVKKVCHRKRMSLWCMCAYGGGTQ